jgi:glycosyltransferase involved in cell wall biosynthesis
VHVRVYVYGSGPRTRRIAGALAADALATAIVRPFADEQAAVLAAGHSAIPVILLDARAAVEPAAFARFALGTKEASARATRFDGTLDPVPAARRYSNGDALRAGVPAVASLDAVGAWMEEPSAGAVRPCGLGVDVHAYGWGPSGFATASRNLMIGLTRAGVDVNWLHWVPEQETAELFAQDRALLETLQTGARKHDRALVFHPPTHTSGQEYIEAYSRAFVGDPYACVTMFETDAIPVQWIEMIAERGRLWLPSRFNVETFAAAGVPRELIDLVPIGLDIENLPIDGETLDLPERRAVAFVSVFEWTYRKGWDVLLAAWAQAFTRADDVCLIVRTSFRSLDVENTIRTHLTQWGFDPAKVAPIVVLPKKLTQAHLAALYRSADAYVLPSRGEGFGLPYLEAMALGLPVIGTAWSGMTDFVDAKTGYLIDARLAPITSPMISRIVPIYKDQRWAEPSIPSTVEQLRRVAAQRDEARIIGARGTALARTQFNRTRIGRIAAEALERIVPTTRTARAPGSSGRVALQGDLYTLNGGGSDARGLLAALDSERFEVAIGPDGDATWMGFIDRPSAARVRRGLDHPPRGDEPAIVAGAAERLVLPATTGTTIARVAATQATLAPRCAGALRAFDELWVPSQFSADRFATAGIDPARIAVVPPAIDVARWSPQIGGVEVSPNASTLRLLCVIHWDERSGWDVALTAFLRAFEPADDVALTLKVVLEDPLAPLPDFQNDVIGAVQRLAPQRLSVIGSYPLNLVTGMSQEVDIIQYIGSFDALVCTRREIGWGRTLLEAMAVGVAVVAPRPGNHRSFVSEDNAFLYDAAATTSPTRFEPDADALARLLRRLFERREEIVGRTHLARRTVAAGNSLEAVGKIARRRLEARVERPHGIPETTPYAIPPAAPRLGIVLDARFEPEHRERALAWIARMTTSPYEVVTVDGTLRDAFARVAALPYVAYMRSAVCVSHGWDDFLVDALRCRPHIAFAVPRTFDVPGVQGQLDVQTDPRVREIDGQFVSFARQISVVHTGRGTTLTNLSACCVAFERGRLDEASARAGAFDSIDALARAALAGGRLAWCAQDCVVHNGGCGAASMIDLRPTAAQR